MDLNKTILKVTAVLLVVCAVLIASATISSARGGFRQGMPTGGGIGQVQQPASVASKLPSLPQPGQISTRGQGFAPIQPVGGSAGLTPSIPIPPPVTNVRQAQPTGSALTGVRMPGDQVSAPLETPGSLGISQGQQAQQFTAQPITPVSGVPGGNQVATTPGFIGAPGDRGPLETRAQPITPVSGVPGGNQVATTPGFIGAPGGPGTGAQVPENVAGGGQSPQKPKGPVDTVVDGLVKPPGGTGGDIRAGPGQTQPVQA
jgi:hypothetical protein